MQLAPVAAKRGVRYSGARPEVAMSLAPRPHRITVTEFLALPGDGTGRRAELIEGIVRLQDPASDAHGTISSNLTMAIGIHLRESCPGCRVVTEPGIEPRFRAEWNYRVPELGVTCQPNRPDQHMMPEPILLIEILSPSNEDATWSNIPLYASLPSVQEILICNSTRVAVEILRRQPDGTWPETSEQLGRNGTSRLASIGLEFSVMEAYRGTWMA